MQAVSIELAAAALAVALLALVVYHLAAVRPALARLGKLAAVHDGMLAGGSGGAADRLAELEAAAAAATAELERVRS
ncbi:MAG TPA: hypothetical protein VMH02_04045, partial [Verrucomicrobiae bacterium]|nr:hypothetical protein [Verrucomicrobiae bacterium]